MFRTEDAERVRRILNSAEAATQTRISEEQAALAKLDTAQRADELQKRNENERMLRATGVVTLFEEIRNSGIVTWNNHPIHDEKDVYIFFGREKTPVSFINFEPALVVEFYEIGRIGLAFNHGHGSYKETLDGIEAYLDEGDELVIEGSDKMQVGINLSLADAVGRAILNPKKLEKPEFEPEI